MRALKDDNLNALFNPESIAIIGATPDFNRIGGRPLKYLQQNNYQGSIFPVNPKYVEIAGLRCYPDINDINDTIDLAIISVSKQLVLDIFKKCAKKGVRSVIIFSAGFAELNEEGERLQDDISEIAKKNGIRVLGPNCLGMFNVNKGAFATFSTIISEGAPLKGRIGFVSQSGAFGSYVFTLAKQNQIGFSYFMATGNESDVDVADCISFLAQDKDTDVIACYIEGTKDGDKLLEAFKLAAENKKPIVAFKVGRTDVGKKAALSHTGSLAGSDEVFDTIFKQYGVYRAETMDEFLDVAYACSKLTFPKGDRVAVFTVSGGIGILMADQLSEYSLTLPEPPVDIQQKLSQLLPIAGVKNPIDTTAEISNNPNLLADFMDIVLSSGKYDSALVFLAFAGLNPNTVNERINALTKIAEKYKDIPQISITLSNEKSKKAFIDKGLVLYEDPSRAVKVVKALNYFQQYYKAEQGHVDNWEKKDISLPSHSTVLTEYRSKKVLQQCDIPITNEKLATSVDEAVAYASEIGFPIALKGMSPQILHKTDLGLVQLNINSEEEIKKNFSFIKNQISKVENATFEGVLVQEMLDKDSLEIYVGSKQDPTFGQILLVGMGGIYIEVLNDVVMRKAPVSIKEAEQMIEELRGNRIINGYRGKQSRDIGELSRLISQFSYFIANSSETIQEVDLNPVMVFAEGNGVKVADALITLNR